MSDYALNSPFIYHYNGISLYSSFDGDILNIMTRHSKLICQLIKAALIDYLAIVKIYLLWNVNDRIRVNHDDNLPYGFKINSEHKDNKVRFKNTIHYPSAHITNKVFSIKN